MRNNTAVEQSESRSEALPFETTENALYTPRVDIVENEDELTIFADLPGVTAQEVNVRFENGELVLHGRCAPRHPGVNYLLEEYGVGNFYRAFAVSEHVDSERIHAELKNGVLTLHLPKTAAVKPRKIAVKAH